MPDCMIIDLSHHNVVTDFARVKAAGVVGVIHKATEGTTFTDNQYKGREKAALAAGLAWGSYHFLKHSNVPAQIANYLKFAAPLPGARVCIDYEDAACTLDDLHSAVTALVAADDSLQIAIYSGHLIKEQLGNAEDPLLSKCALWIAQYASKPSWPDETWPYWSLWQYSDKGRVSGIQGDVDCNVFNGDRDQALAWMGPAVEPDIKPEFEVSVRVPAGMRYSILVNGAMMAGGMA